MSNSSKSVLFGGQSFLSLKQRSNCMFAFHSGEEQPASSSRTSTAPPCIMPLPSPNNPQVTARAGHRPRKAAARGDSRENCRRAWGCWGQSPGRTELSQGSAQTKRAQQDPSLAPFHQTLIGLIRHDCRWIFSIAY